MTVGSLLQEVPQVHLGLDLHPHRLLPPPPLLLRPSLPLAFPAPPLPDWVGRIAVVVLPAPPDPAGGCVGGLLRTRGPRPGRPELRLFGAASPAPPRRPDKSLVPQRQHGVARVRGLPGHPRSVPVLPADRGGNVRLRPAPGPGEAPPQVAWGPVETPFPFLCNPALRVDVLAFVCAGVLPRLAIPAAGRSTGLPGLEGTLSGVVQTPTELELPWFTRRGAFSLHQLRQTELTTLDFLQINS